MRARIVPREEPEGKTDKRDRGVKGLKSSERDDGRGQGRDKEAAKEFIWRVELRKARLDKRHESGLELNNAAGAVFRKLTGNGSVREICVR